MISELIYRSSGVLLCLAAFAKCHLLLTNPYSDLVSGYPIWFLVCGVAVEFSIGFWNISCDASKTKGVVNIALFSLLAITSGSRILLGYEDCHCMPIVQLTPLASLALSISLVATFAFILTPACQTVKNRKIELEHQQNFMGWFAGTAVFGLVLFGLQQHLHANSSGSPKQVEVGEIALGESKTVTIKLKNVKNRETRIVGFTKSCVCIEAANVPDRVAQESVEFPIIVSPKKTGPIHERITIFTDSDSQFRVTESRSSQFCAHLNGSRVGLTR